MSVLSFLSSLLPVSYVSLISPGTKIEPLSLAVHSSSQQTVTASQIKSLSSQIPPVEVLMKKQEAN